MYSEVQNQHFFLSNVASDLGLKLKMWNVNEFYQWAYVTDIVVHPEYNDTTVSSYEGHVFIT